MNAILWPVFDYVAKNRWLQIVLAVLTGWVFVMIYLHFRDSGVRERERADQKRRELEEQARLNETVTQIGQETEDAKDRALDAPSHIDDVSSVDELRDRFPANAEVILRPREASSGKGPR